MSEQRDLITKIGEQTFTKFNDMAKIIGMSRQLFNTKINKDQLTKPQIIKLSLKLKYESNDIKSK